MLMARETAGRLKGLPSLRPVDLFLFAAAAALVLPTMIEVARFSWTTEQGGHGPIILATGLWLLWRELKENAAERKPPRALLPAIGLAILLAIFTVARITSTLEIEALAMYGALLTGAYMLLGGRLMRHLWFPLIYLGLTLPPPDSLVATITQPVKIVISSVAVSLLHALGYPIASSGVMIQIAQYQLLVAAACAGLNSLVTLSAICLFYVYLRHRSSMVNFVVVGLAVLPVAIFSNFLRVIILILITYYMGEAAAQGFLHDFAGLTMFAIALVTIMGVDDVVTRIMKKRRAKARS